MIKQLWTKVDLNLLGFSNWRVLYVCCRHGIHADERGPGSHVAGHAAHDGRLPDETHHLTTTHQELIHHGEEWPLPSWLQSGSQQR